MKCNIILAFLILTSFCTCKKSADDRIKKVFVSTIAGSGDAGILDGAALSAMFRTPWDVAVLPDGSLYVADLNNHRLRKITSQGQVVNVAGDGGQDTVNGKGITARFKEISFIADDAAGNCYVLDNRNPQVRKVTPNGEVSLYAGIGFYGYGDGPPDLAIFGHCYGIVVDAEGNVIVADATNNRIRRINMSRQVTTLAGSGMGGYTDGSADTARFKVPSGLAIDRQGIIYVSDNGNNRIRKITSAGVVSTFAGSGVIGYQDGNSSVAKFSNINDMVVDSKGNLYVTDQNRIRKITPNGDVSTLAGGEAGFADGEGSVARFNLPIGLSIDAAGNIYVADALNYRIRKLTFK